MPIDSGDVVAAAVRILDDYGMADLSMRRVADALGVKAGALYWHVANKQTLLALVADEVLAEVAPPGSGTAADLVHWADDLREALLRHRDSAELVATALASGLCRTDPLAGVQAVLGDGPRSRWAAQALLHLVTGHVAQEQNARLFAELGALPGTPVDGQEAFGFAVSALVDGLLAAVPADHHVNQNQ